MLREFTKVRQEQGTGRRRWFESEDLELIVWLDGRGEWEGFQICYNLGAGEHALTWRPGVGFAHSGVDDGDGEATRNLTPILVPDGEVPWGELIKRFDRQAGSLEPAVRERVGHSLAARR